MDKTSRSPSPLLFEDAPSGDSSDEDRKNDGVEFKRRRRTSTTGIDESEHDEMQLPVVDPRIRSGTYRHMSLPLTPFGNPFGDESGNVIVKSTNVSYSPHTFHNGVSPPMIGNTSQYSGLAHNTEDIPPADLSDPKVLRRQNKAVIENPKKPKIPDEPGNSSATTSKLVNNPFDMIAERKQRRDGDTQTQPLGLDFEGAGAKFVLENPLKTKVCYDQPTIFSSKTTNLENNPFSSNAESTRRIDNQAWDMDREDTKKLLKRKKRIARAQFQESCKAPEPEAIASDSDDDAGPVTYNLMEEVINVEEIVAPIPAESFEVLDISVLTVWRKIGQKIEAPSRGVTKFAAKSLHQQLQESRETIAGWNERFLLSARFRANPFETLRHAFFMNRAAVKIANLDAILGFGLTSPKTKTGEKMVGDNELFYFADVCAGPGGFSEYVLWRKQWEAKGFGFTLRECDCDFNLEQFLAGTPESFEVNYGAKGDGNVLDPANVSSFIRYVVHNTNGKGVHLMMADGGIEVDDRSQQEEVCKGLYLAQCLVALCVVREGGNFVCKLFDITTPFSVGLVYLMYRSFEEVAIHKPHSSRPANPERYLICKWRRNMEATIGIYMYLQKCHAMLWKYQKNAKPGIAPLDIFELVPMEILTKKESKFFKYIKTSNNVLATRQILALQKMAIYYEDQKMTEIRQNDCRQVCMVYWELPDMTRRAITRESGVESAAERFNSIRNTYKASLLDRRPTVLQKNMIEEVFKSPYDWRFIVLGNGPIRISHGFFYGLGGTTVMRFQANYWQPMSFNISMPKDTCVYAELVVEVSVDLSVKVNAFHIIDAFILGGKDIRNFHYTQRHEFCVRFAEAMSKPGTPGAVPVRAKPLTRLEHIESIFGKIIPPEGKEGAPPPKGSERRLFPIEIPENTEKYFQPVGLLFLKITKEPWIMDYSPKAGRKYWFNKNTKESTFDCPPSAIADFKYTTENSVHWFWDENTQTELISTLISNPANEFTNDVHPKQIMNHVERFLARVVPPQIAPCGDEGQGQ